MPDELVSVLIGGILAVLGGFLAQLYQSHRDDLAAKRARIMRVVKWCRTGEFLAKHQADRLTVDPIVPLDFAAEVQTECLEIYHHTLEDLGGAMDAISSPLQKEVEEYCDLLFHVSKLRSYDIYPSGGMTPKGIGEAHKDLQNIEEKGDSVSIKLLREQGSLVDFRPFRVFLAKHRAKKKDSAAQEKNGAASP